MIGRRLYPRRRVRGVQGSPPWEVTFMYGWSTWLLGWDYEPHPHEWSLTVHAGPIALRVDRVH